MGCGIKGGKGVIELLEKETERLESEVFALEICGL